MIQYIVVTVLLFALWVYLANRKPPNYPKGPFCWPVLGNFPQLVYYAKGVFWQHLFEEYDKVYKGIFSFNIGPVRSIVISDLKVIREALNHPSIQGRPGMLTSRERTGGVTRGTRIKLPLITRYRNGILFQEGSEWHEQRRFALRNLRDFGFGKTSMEEMIMDEVKELIQGIKKDCGKPILTQNRFNIAVLNALWTITTGNRFKQDDPELKQVLAILTRNISENATGAIASFFPILTKVCPGLIGWERFKEDLASMYNYLKTVSERQIQNYDENNHDNFSAVFIKEIRQTTDPQSSFYGKRGELTMRAVLLDLFVAGAETTSTTLTWACLILSLYPEKQKKLHEELDRVLGGKTPSLDDSPRLPYTEAVIMETMRFASLVPLVGHSATEDVKLNGYNIPKKTLIFANLHAVHHNPEIWGDPENYRPERFLNDDGTCRKHEALIPFAIGKRVCLGESLARNELFLFLTALLQSFQVTWDREGPKPGLDGVDGPVVGPKPHKIVFTSRT